MKHARHLLTASSFALLAGCVSTPVQESQFPEAGKWYVTPNGQVKIALGNGRSYVFTDFKCNPPEQPKSYMALRDVSPGPDASNLTQDDKEFIRDLVESYESGKFRRQIYVDGRVYEDGLQKTAMYDPQTSSLNYVSFYWTNSELIEAMRRGSEMKFVYKYGTAKGTVETIVPLTGSSTAMDAVDCG